MAFRSFCATLAVLAFVGCSNNAGEETSTVAATPTSPSSSPDSEAPDSASHDDATTAVDSAVSASSEADPATADSATADPANPSATSDEPTPAAEASATELVDSRILRKELHDYVAALMKAKSPEESDAAIEQSAEKMMESEISKMSTRYPPFLKVTQQREQALAANQLDPGATQRVNDALKIIDDLQVEAPQLAAALIEEHKQEMLSPVRTELLAHLLEQHVDRIKKQIEE